jgi:hypothetical protein
VTNIARTIPHVLASFRRTCRHCRASTSDVRDPIVGFTCCDDAARDQLAWRTDELARLRAQAKQEQDRVDELDAEARLATGYKVDEAVAKADRARRALTRRLREHYTPLADELKGEISRVTEYLERREAERRGGDRRASDRREE